MKNFIEVTTFDQWNQKMLIRTSEIKMVSECVSRGEKCTFIEYGEDTELLVVETFENVKDQIKEAEKNI